MCLASCVHDHYIGMRGYLGVISCQAMNVVPFSWRSSSIYMLCFAYTSVQKNHSVYVGVFSSILADRRPSLLRERLFAEPTSQALKNPLIKFRLV